MISTSPSLWWVGLFSVLDWMLKAESVRKRGGPIEGPRIKKDKSKSQTVLIQTLLLRALRRVQYCSPGGRTRRRVGPTTAFDSAPVSTTSEHYKFVTTCASHSGVLISTVNSGVYMAH